ncbi:hypothetical protein J4460_01405 [Candidatus Woesearchaeota archaeon]|nr:MAG: hypothetical protein QS99_C0001G0096 [archaeon GW2011_AR4]MBS3129307.1 hypothetical protein [Candidatus Woesearchaeota archaeon]HIH38610.1 hypothetical protein [Candidatus Woesearchaeota archaeon]HIH49451.1 hypothetical protein [Candidatus Woesearchaeota archaeon]HIJ02814.1 hypothetical protein [Candidatus Woesearchaeota archaeon]
MRTKTIDQIARLFPLAKFAGDNSSENVTPIMLRERLWTREEGMRSVGEVGIPVVTNIHSFTSYHPRYVSSRTVALTVFDEKFFRGQDPGKLYWGNSESSESLIDEDYSMINRDWADFLRSFNDYGVRVIDSDDSDMGKGLEGLNIDETVLYQTIHYAFSVERCLQQHLTGFFRLYDAVLDREDRSHPSVQLIRSCYQDLS